MGGKTLLAWPKGTRAQILDWGCSQNSKVSFLLDKSLLSAGKEIVGKGLRVKGRLGGPTDGNGVGMREVQAGSPTFSTSWGFAVICTHGFCLVVVIFLNHIIYPE